MENNNVIAPAAFGAFKVNEEKLSTMKSEGLLIADAPKFDTLELPEPQVGEQVLGTLTDAEVELFESYSYAAQRLEDLGREMSGEQFTAIGNAIKNKAEAQLMKDGMLPPEENIAEFYKLQRQVECLKSTFFWALCEKYNVHEFVVGVRSRRRFIRGITKVEAMKRNAAAMQRGY